MTAFTRPCCSRPAAEPNALRALIKAEQDRGPDFLRLANALVGALPEGQRGEAPARRDAASGAEVKTRQIQWLCPTALSGSSRGCPASRSYADVFLKHGVALIGPGDAGPWKAERSDDEFEGSFVRRFASEMQAGDALLLRTGIASISAVGIVAGDYLYLNAFDDVNGWDLQHARRVRWGKLPAGI